MAPNKRVVSTLAMALIVLLELPAVGVIVASLYGPNFGPEKQTIGAWVLLGWFAPPAILVGLVVAVPTLIASPRVRRSPLVWIAVLMGVVALQLHRSVYGGY